MRVWHAWVQAEKSVIGVFGLERLQGPIFQNLHLLLGIGKLQATVLQ
jgi:hypothetical protein